MTKPDLKGKTIEIQGKRYLVMSCAFRQPSDRDAAGWAMLLVNERGELDQHMVGIDGPITVIDGPRPPRTEQQWSAPPAEQDKRRVQRDPSKPVTEITWSEYPPQMARSVAARAGMDEQVAKMHPIALSPEVAAAIADAPKVVQNAPLKVDRNRFLGSVPIGKDGNCACRPADTCPMGKRGGSENRCTFDELTAAGHNWHHDKPGTDNGATVGTTAIREMTAGRVPDARIVDLWESADSVEPCAGPFALPATELRALCEEVNSHRRAATAHHNSKHMQALRDQVYDGQQRVKRLELQLVEARNAAKFAARESNEHRDARSGADHRAQVLAEDLACANNAISRLERRVDDDNAVVARLQRERDSADEQVRIMSATLEASTAENGKLVATVERLEHEIALVTKCPTPMPQLPTNTREDDDALVFASVPVGADRVVTDPVRLAQWTRVLVAERNHCRGVAIALQRRIDAMARTMSPIAPAHGMPAPSLVTSPTVLHVNAESPYKRD